VPLPSESASILNELKRRGKYSFYIISDYNTSRVVLTPVELPFLPLPPPVDIVMVWVPRQALALVGYAVVTSTD
jgi:hypothetical protein